MKIVYTEQSIESLAESLRFLIQEQGLSFEKVSEIKTILLDKADKLTENPFIGQIEEHLEHLNKEHRRIIENNFKIIYRVEGNVIYVTDFFDTRQDPNKMNG